MIITCPACHAQFHLQPNALGAQGRTVRCSSCGERWFAEPFVEPAPDTAAIVAASATEPRPVGARIGLTSVLAGIRAVLILAALIAGRDKIASRVPAMISLYQRLGFSLELPLGIEFRGLASQHRLAEGRPMLVVMGEISNISAQRRAVPPIRVTVLDAQRREQIADDAVVAQRRSRHREHFTIDELMAKRAANLGGEVVLHADGLAMVQCGHDRALCS